MCASQRGKNSLLFDAACVWTKNGSIDITQEVPESNSGKAWKSVLGNRRERAAAAVPQVASGHRRNDSA